MIHVKFSNRILDEVRTGCFVLIVMWLSVLCISSLRCRGLVSLQSAILAFPGHTHLLFIDQA